MERLLLTLDLSSVWDEYFDVSADSWVYSTCLSPDFKKQIPEGLLRQKEIAELNFINASMGFLLSHLSINPEVAEQLSDRQLFLNLFPEEIQRKLSNTQYGLQYAFDFGCRRSLTNEAQVNTFISELNEVTALLRWELPPGWTQHSPASENFAQIRERLADDGYSASLWIDSEGNERYIAYRDWWVIELREKGGQMKITNFGPVD